MIYKVLFFIFCAFLTTNKVQGQIVVNHGNFYIGNQYFHPQIYYGYPNYQNFNIYPNAQSVRAFYGYRGYYSNRYSYLGRPQFSPQFIRNSNNKQQQTTSEFSPQFLRNIAK